MVYRFKSQIFISVGLSLCFTSLISKQTISQTVEQRILGTWRSTVEMSSAKRAFFAVFMSDGRLFMLDINGEVYELEYRLNGQTKPIQIDFYNAGLAKSRKPFLSILEFTEDGSLKIQDVSQSSEVRPTKFDEQSSILTRFSNSTKLPTDFPEPKRSDNPQIDRAGHSIIKNIISINRHQTAYRIEKGAFSPTLKDLGLTKLESKDRQEAIAYSYQILAEKNRSYVVATPINKAFKSYVGATFRYLTHDGLTLVSSIVCQSKEPTRVAPLPQLAVSEYDTTPVCASDSEKIQPAP